jgi:hypothetical protein
LTAGLVMVEEFISILFFCPKLETFFPRKTSAFRGIPRREPFPIATA